MWLINTETIRLEEFIGIPEHPYAILSHTWEDEEVFFKEMRDGASDAVRNKKGYLKIKHTCEEAAREGLLYAWVDTCCIDKSSSAELSEAINSMHKWYQRAKTCYAFLFDLQPYEEYVTKFPDCR
jgi:hypothetical protein